MDISVLGIDLGKNVCSVVGLDASGAVVMRRKVRREALIALAEKLPPSLSGWRPAAGLITSRPPQRCDRRLRQQAGEDRLGGVEAERAVCRGRTADGGVDLVDQM
jgi:hypothetical protein